MMVSRDNGLLAKAAGAMGRNVGECLRQCCQRMGRPTGRSFAVGLHGDGVPHKKKKSIVVWSWNLVAFLEAERFLCTAIGNEFMCKCGCHGRHTLDACMDVFVWSLEALHIGAFPKLRHDGKEWTKDDKFRQKYANSDRMFGFYAYMIQCRGDWSWWKELCFCSLVE